jgi:hypothetical protein
MSQLIQGSDKSRPGLNSQDRGVSRNSRKLDGSDVVEETDMDKQLKQLKLIKTHMEVLTGEELELSQNDDDDSGGSL